jgi:ABC-2 type transport system ATP-binding protein
MRVIRGLDAPDAGTALIGGRPYRKLHPPLCHVGSLLDAAAIQPGRSARNHLLWLACSQGLNAKRVDVVIAETGLAKVTRRKAGGFSLGMRQRLGIASAMLGDPPVLMFEEPVNGLAPKGIVWIREYLQSLAGAMVTASGPDMVTVSRLAADRIVALLVRSAVPFSVVVAHRATLEEGYLELTHDAVQFRSEPVQREAR